MSDEHHNAPEISQELSKRTYKPRRAMKGTPSYEGKKQRKERSDKWDPSTEQMESIKVMAGLRLKLWEIAQIIGVHPKTFSKYMRLHPDLKATIEKGRAVGVMNVSRAAYNMAKSEKHPEMTKFWLKAQAKWRDVQSVELSRGPDYENYSDEDLEAEICEQERILELMEPIQIDRTRLVSRVRTMPRK